VTDVTMDVLVIASLLMALVFPYLLYPLVVRYLFRPIDRAATPATSTLPTVSILIPAHNEGPRIAEKLENVLALDYPAECLEVLVASDGSVDDTAAVARTFEGRGVRVSELEARGGKLTALKQLLGIAGGELILFTDVGASLPRQTLQELVKEFSDPNVAVAMPRYATDGRDATASAESAYWDRETRLKQLEADRDMLLGAHGACYLMRRSSIFPIPKDTIHDDFLWPLLARASGRRIAYRSDIAIPDEPPQHLSTVFHRTARMAHGNLQILWRNRTMLRPRYGRVAVSLIGHKLVKTLGPVWILTLAGWVNYRALEVQALRPLALFGDSLLVLLLVATAWRASGRTVGRALGVGVHALVAQAACGAGIVRFLTGRQGTRWRRPREQEALTLQRPALPPRSVRITKRVVDLIGGALGVIVSAPLIPFIAIAIRLDSPGPIFYRQSRVATDAAGDEYHFLMCKFRTMRVDAEADGQAVWATEEDPRITRVGAFLRKTRLDEVPQLFQVLFGQMSLIGPRPERPSISEVLAAQLPGYDDRMVTCKPGITGWAQVHTGYDTSVESVREKLLYDFAYTAHLYKLRDYLWMETRVVVLTVAVMIYGKGAR
jgi:lipopolysaccharide/colanic/teichoic acid biosynthesis glycosyltransferase